MTVHRSPTSEVLEATRPWREGDFVRAILDVQELVAEEAPAERVYQTALDGAVGLLRGHSGSIRFVDLEDRSWMVAVASTGVTGKGERWRQRAPITEGASGLVISTGALVALEDIERTRAGSQLAPEDTQAVIGVPIRERGRVIGSLVVATSTAGRRWTGRERALLEAYGEHVSVALAVARAGHAVHRAYSDSLTGLGNRALLLDRLDHELAQADRGGEPATVLFLDLDGFKLVNDSLGHLAGDELLVAVSNRLRKCVRDGDVCARLGGDEFAILLPGARDPVVVAKRVIEIMKHGFDIAGHEVFVSVSVGIASGREDANTVLRNADVAMYQAKRAGGGRYQRFEPSMHAARLSRLDLGAELRRAIERDEFELHYQPMVELASGRIAALESLLRWRHPIRGMVAPLEFIPLAEETGLIVEIGRWVLEEACTQFARWWRQAPLAVSVNVSMHELHRPGYADVVERAINGGFPPSALILEVTESAQMVDARAALGTLGAVRELGARIALDDFGTGYSSLLNLSHLPVDLLKVPRPFLAGVGGEGAPAAGLLAGTIALGRHIGLTTVAEGIERPEQRELLVALGCDLGQGYLLGRPSDRERTTRLLAAGHAESRS